MLNMPSLERVLKTIKGWERPEIVDAAPRDPRLNGMDATVTNTVRITSTPQMGGGYPTCPCGKTLGHPGPCSSDGPPSEPKK